MDFAIPADHRVRIKESEKIDEYLDLAREMKKLSKMKMTELPIVAGALRSILKNLEKRLRDTGNQRKNQNYPDHSSVKINKNT